MLYEVGAPTILSAVTGVAVGQGFHRVLEVLFDYKVIKELFIEFRFCDMLYIEELCSMISDRSSQKRSNTNPIFES